MYEFGAPPKKNSGQVKSGHATAAIPIGLATANHATSDRVAVIGILAFEGNHRAAALTDRTSSKREYSVPYSLLVAILQKCL